jgi:hypothetical protein
MGYHVQMSCHDVRIPADKVAQALKEVNALHKPEVMEHLASGGSFSGGQTTERWYSWVKNPPPEGFSSLVEALIAWRYAADENDGEVEVAYFDGEKLGDDRELWSTLAPFIDDGAIIECRGEDDSLWRWCFNGKTIIEQTGYIKYV